MVVQQQRVLPVCSYSRHSAAFRRFARETKLKPRDRTHGPSRCTHYPTSLHAGAWPGYAVGPWGPKIQRAAYRMGRQHAHTQHHDVQQRLPEGHHGSAQCMYSEAIVQGLVTHPLQSRRLLLHTHACQVLPSVHAWKRLLVMAPFCLLLSCGISHVSCFI